MKKSLLVLLLVILFTSCEDDCTQEAYCQLLSSQNYGKSESSEKEDKIEVCHNGNTLEINADSLQDHLNHGDTKGACGTLSSNNLEFKDGQIVDIPCGYEMPFIHVTNNGTQWRYSSPKDRW